MRKNISLYDSKKPFKILSIDGGGIRGLYPARFLSELEYQLELDSKPSEIYKYFDLICGTSTGGIIAIGLALGMKASDIVSLYAENAKDIFGNGNGFLGSFFRPKHRKINLRSLLRQEFDKQVDDGCARLGHARTRLCIPTFNGFNGRLSVLKTCHHGELNRDFHYPAVDIALAASAAPTFFSPHSFSYTKVGEDEPRQISNYIDGGIVANNPSLIGVLEALKTLEVPLENIKLLSIGTGRSSFKETSKKKGWGLYYWINPYKKRLMELIFSSQTDSTINTLKFLNEGVGNNGSKNFVNERLQFTFDDIKPIKLDEYKKQKLDWLKEQADNDFQLNGTRIIKQFCNDIITPYKPFYEL